VEVPIVAKLLEPPDRRFIGRSNEVAEDVLADPAALLLGRVPLIEQLAATGTPAMPTRGRKLLESLRSAIVVQQPPRGQGRTRRGR